MKGLLKYLSPFAPDQSGAASVLYDMGGLTIICDAGGCTGNICGFDEPRWFLRKSAIFSAGLRDMDAILGRDDRMVEKIQDAAKKLDADFTALIGTPVPAVIATDFKALSRMAEKRCHLPVLTVECTGTRLYDEGEADTWLGLFRKFAGTGSGTTDDEIKSAREKNSAVSGAERRTDSDKTGTWVSEDTSESGAYGKGAVGVIGMTPLNLSRIDADQIIRDELRAQGFGPVYCYGMRDGLETIKKAGETVLNLVVSPSSLPAARYLEQRFGTPYRMEYPFLGEELKKELHAADGKKILVIHQQAAANAIRAELRKNSGAEITVGTWFLLDEEFREPQDVHLTTEENFARLVTEGQYDVIVGDRMLERVLRNYEGRWMHVPHFAVSGELEETPEELSSCATGNSVL